jgi:ribose/xylose/arabinose/galactoside ABC-type transport system permease subunit
VLVLLVALIVFFSVTQDVFLDSQNIKNLLTAVAVLWVLSIGMTFALLTGGVDLSVGSIAALSGIVLAKLLGLGIPAGVVIVLVVLAGGAIGLIINGLLIGRLGLSFFVVTLATMIALAGVVSIWANTQSFFISSPTIVSIGQGEWLGIPIAVWIMAGTLAIGLYVQQRTYFGRDVYAVGGSIQAARLSGIRTSRTVVAVYGVSGMCAGLAGLIACGRVGAASPVADNAVALQAVAAVLLGGTSLLGGAGGLGGTALGVIFIGVLQNGLSIAGVQSFWQQVVTGVILLVAVLGDRLADDERIAAWRRSIGRSRRSAVAPADSPTGEALQ